MLKTQVNWRRSSVCVCVCVCVCVMAVVVGFHRVYIVLMETMREGGKLSLSSDQLMELTSSLSFLSSAQALPVKTQSLSRSSTPLNADDQQQLSELQPLSLPANDLPGTSLPLLFARAHWVTPMPPAPAEIG